MIMNDVLALVPFFLQLLRLSEDSDLIGNKDGKLAMTGGCLLTSTKTDAVFCTQQDKLMIL